MSAVRSIVNTRSATLISALLLSSTFTVPAFAQIETVIVTAEKKAEDIQTVPIAVTAFGAADLQSKQIHSFNDIQFNMPSFTFNKSSLGGQGASIAIRGIGPGTISASADAGVAYNVNDIYVDAPQLGANAAYMDIERIEVLRGPQGTLFGRNATGGAFNVVTTKPDLDNFMVSGEATYGNYNDREITGVVNLPIIDGKLGLRIAGFGALRDGDVTNIYTKIAGGVSDGVVNSLHGPVGTRKFDGLDNYSGRATLRWEPTADTTIDIIAEHDQESSTRVGANVLGCITDPSGIFGCLPTGLKEQSINQNGVVTNTFISDIGPLGGTPYQVTTIGGAAAIPGISPQPTSTDFYRTSVDFQPSNDNHFDQIQVLLHQKLTDYLAFDLHANYDLRKYNSAGGAPNDNNNPYFYDGTAATAQYAETGLQAFFLNKYFTGASPAPLHAASPPGPCALANPTNNPTGQRLTAVEQLIGCAFPTTYGIYYGGHLGLMPISGTNLYGISGGGSPAYYDDHAGAYTVLSGSSEQKSVEARFSSSFDGPFNFLLAAYHLIAPSVSDTKINSATLDLISAVFGATKGADGFAFGPGVYDNVNTYKLETDAVYGEVYYNLTDTLKFTGGLRFSSDHKQVLGFNTFLNCLFPIGAITGAALTNFLVSPTCGAEAPPTTHSATTTVQDAQFSAMTGRGVIDWTPKLSFTDQTLVYLSYARGYRAGGFNPAQDSLSAGTYPITYKSEGVDAIELGTKNGLFDNTLQANLDFWYYNYQNYQIASIQNKTAINTNIGAHMWGAEGEFVWAPDDHWAFNANYSIIDSGVGKNQFVVDSRNIAQNAPNTTILKDYTGANCIISSALGTPYPIAGTDGSGHPFYTDPVLATVLKQAPVTSIPGVANGTAWINGSASGAFGVSCATLKQALDAAYGGPALDPIVYSSGLATNVTGKKIPNTPPLSIGFGVQYKFDVFSGYSLVPRVDYYWKGADYFTVFNTVEDRIPSWDEINAQVQLNSPDSMWYARAWVKNLANKQNLTGGGAGDQAQGLFNTLYVEPPRTFGVSLGAHW